MDTIKQNFEALCRQAQLDGVRLEMLLTGGENLKLGYQKRKLEKFESTQSQMAGLRVIDGASQGYAYTENLSSESLMLTYKEALRNAQTLKSETAESPVPLAKPQTVPDMSHLNIKKDVDMQRKLEIAEKLEALTLQADPRVQAVPYCGFNESTGFKRILNSEGVDVKFESSVYTGYSYALAKEGETSKMDGDSFFVRDFEQIKPEAVAQESARKAVSRLGAKPLETGKYPAILDRDLMPAFITMLAGHLSAQEVLDGKSLLKGKVSEKIANDLFTLKDDPFDERGASVRPFDSEGTASRKTVLFEKGVLKSFLTNLETAAKLGMENTGNASRSPASKLDISPSNLIVETGKSTLQEMLSAHPKVVHVTEMNGGLHAGYKESTGDFSLPCEGFLYENGKLVGAVDQFVMSGNILDLIQNIEMVGNELNKAGNSYLSPDILIKSLSFAGK